MENTAVLTELLQRAVNTMYQAEKYEEAALHVAQKLCLQGEKRRLRYESVKSHNMINYLITDTYDVLGISLERIHHEVKMPSSISIKGFFEMYHRKMTEQYSALHKIANDLVVNNYRGVAMKLFKVCDCLVEDIKYYNRVIMDGNATGWDTSFLLQYQTTWHNVHDCYEAKEKTVGYDF